MTDRDREPLYAAQPAPQPPEGGDEPIRDPCPVCGHKCAVGVNAHGWRLACCLRMQPEPCGYGISIEHHAHVARLARAAAERDELQAEYAECCVRAEKAEEKRDRLAKHADEWGRVARFESARRFEMERERDEARAAAERDELREKLDDLRESRERTMRERCDLDEHHCTCVPFLREALADLRAEAEKAERERDELRDRFKDTHRWAQKWSGRLIERAFHRGRNAGTNDTFALHLIAKNDEARAEVARLREALRQRDEVED